MDFSMRINIKKVGERYIVTDDANIRILDTGLKGKDAWQHYFDVRHEQACEGKETTNENSRFNAVAVIKSLPKISTFNSICIKCELYKWYINNNPDIPF